MHFESTPAPPITPMLRTVFTLLLVLSNLTTVAADNLQPRLTVVASHYPLAYFAGRIAADHADVHLPMPGGIDPADWRPGSSGIRMLQRADLLLLNGAGYETWLAQTSLSRARQVDTSSGFSDRLIRIEQAITHSHGGSGQHTHTGTAHTTWLDFSQARQQAHAVAAALGRKRPELKSRFEEHLQALDSDLARLDQNLEALSLQYQTLPLMASHPVYQYLARRYRLDLVSVHWEPDEMPPGSEWDALARTLQQHPARLMIWESQPRPEITRRLTQLGVASVVFDPCANRPDQGDFLSVMQRNLQNLKQARESISAVLQK
jgi:zinc transport system substrate-binding protein